MAAAPPTMMNSTPTWNRTRSSSGKFVVMLLATGFAQFFREFLERHQVVESLLNRQPQVLTKQRPVDVLLVSLNHGIGFDFEFSRCHGLSAAWRPALRNSSAN